MPDNEKAAQRARAKRLRRQIDKLISTREGIKEKPPQDTESPRDFIHRKMREEQQAQSLESEEDADCPEI